MQEVERLREKYNSDLAKDILIAVLRELEKGARVMGFTEKSAKEALEDYILGRPVTSNLDEY